MKKLYEFCRQIVDIYGKPLAMLVRKTAKDGNQRETIIAASVCALQPSTVPYRVVLRFECHKGADGVVGKFIVHEQQTQDHYFNSRNELDLGGMEDRYNWHDGNYFDAVDYIEALTRYQERCRREIEYHKSLMRAAEEPDGSIPR